jgi:hypothetical protein
MMISNVDLYAPLLNVALDQPLYPSVVVRKFVGEKTLTHVLLALNVIATGMIKLFLSTLQNIRQLATTVPILRYTFLFVTLMICTRYLIVQLQKSDTTTFLPSTLLSATRTKNIVPMPFDTNVNEGWAICKLKSITPYGKTPYLHANMILPQRNYMLSLPMGQPLHICGLDRNGNAVQAEFHPFQSQYRTLQQRLGHVSLLLPDPSKVMTRTIDPRVSDVVQKSNTKYQNSNDNTIQQLRVAQLLQDYMKTGDTELAIHPGISKLEYNGSYHPVTEMIYLVIGTGIVPVLEQIPTVIESSSSIVDVKSSSSSSRSSSSSSSTGIERVSVVWINSAMEEFDVLSDTLKNLYERYPTQLAVTCGIETNLISSITQDIAVEYFFNNNVEMKDMIPTYQPGMMAVISIEGLQSSSLLQQAATSYLQRNKGYPIECMCVL